MTLGEVLADIGILANAIDRPDAGVALIDDCATRIDAVRLAVRGAQIRGVAALEWLDPVFVAGHWVPQMIEYAGGIDLLGLPGERSETVDWDAVKDAQPEVVIVMPCGYDAERAQEEAYDFGDELEELGARQVVAVDASGPVQPAEPPAGGRHRDARAHPAPRPGSGRSQPPARGRAVAPHRVLFVHSSAGRYGADRELAVLAETLDRDRVEPTVLLPFEGPLADDIRAAGVDVLFGELAVVRRETLARPWRLLSAVRRTQGPLRRLVAERGIDIVQANTSVILGLRGPAPKLVIHVHEIYPRGPGGLARFRRHLMKADALVCASEATRDGARRGRGHLRRRRVRRAQGRPRRCARASSASRTTGSSRRCWAASPHGRDRRSSSTLSSRTMIGLVAGDAWPGQEQRAEALRRPNTRLLGFRDDVQNVYGAADVVVVPSTSPDPLPNAALEALAAGCCVVAANHGGLPEMIRDGETGVLVPPGDRAALAAALAELRDDPERRTRLGEAAAADVRARFPRDNPARRFEELYDAPQANTTLADERDARREHAHGDAATRCRAARVCA